MLQKKKTIIYLGFNGFPEGFASGERQRLISKSLIESGYRVIIIAHKGTNNKDKIQLPYRGIFDGIEYVFSSGSAYRSNSFFLRNVMKVLGLIGEPLYIIKLRLTTPIDFAIVYSRNLWFLKYYSLFSKILRFKIIVDYTELASAWSGEFKDFEKFEKYSPKYARGAFCISTPLIKVVKQIRPDLPILKVPAICNLQKIDMIETKLTKLKYFLFCGTLFYLEIVEFILDSFLLTKSGTTQLYLVVNGNDYEKEKFHSLLDRNPKKDSIQIFSDLNYSDLIGLYKNALALLIPLRPTMQDTARFPHKIGEYSASGRPIITTNFGEIPNYFTDLENALVAENYLPEEFSTKMEFVINNEEKASMIGLNGKKVAASYFDYRAIGTQLVPFIENLKQMSR